MEVITCCATKGGVGKTTLCANLSAILAEEQSVLMIDADPQPSLTSFFPLASDPDTNSTGLVSLLTSHQPPVPIPTTLPNLDIIVSDDPTGELENRLLHMPDGRFRLFHALQRIEGYDYVVIDTRGARGALVENAVLAADLCVSPLPPEILAAQEFMRGTLALFESLQSFKALGCAPGELTALIYKFDNTNDARSIKQDIQDVLIEGGTRLLQTSVPNRVAYREAATRQIPVHVHEPRRRKGLSAAQTLQELKTELLEILDITVSASDLYANENHL